MNRYNKFGFSFVEIMIVIMIVIGVICMLISFVMGAKMIKDTRTDSGNNIVSLSQNVTKILEIEGVKIYKFKDGCGVYYRLAISSNGAVSLSR